MNYSQITIPLVHYSVSPFIARCGADIPNQSTTTVETNVTCHCCLGDHIWTGQKSNAPTEPDDYYEYCAICGIENQGSFVE